MKFSLLLAGATAALAAPMPADVELAARQIINPLCLLTGQVNQLTANLLVSRYAAVIAKQSSDLGSATATAQQIVDSSYSEQSDSANIQLGIPLGQLTTPSKQVFITQSQSGVPVDTQTLGVYPSGCNNVLWRWKSTNFGTGKTQGTFPVQGFHLFQLDNLGLIQKTYFEFDSLAGAGDIGWTLINPAGQKLTPANA